MLGGVYWFNLLAIAVKCDLHCFLHRHVSFGAEVTIQLVFLLLDCASKLH